MRCFNILGLKEDATEEEINEKYDRLCVRLEDYKDDVSEDMYQRKQQELEDAKIQCIQFRNSGFAGKTKLRMSNCIDDIEDPNKLYTTCIGPCTCIDTNCMNCLCCCTCDAQNGESCCNMMRGVDSNVAPSTICDILIYISIGIWIFSKLLDPIADWGRGIQYENQQRENERNNSLNSVRDSRKLEYMRRLSKGGDSINPELINELRHDVSQNNILTRNELNNYVDNVHTALLSAIKSKNYYAAHIYAQFLNDYDDSYNNWSRTVEDMRILLEFYNSDSVIIMTKKYGVPDKEYIKQMENIISSDTGAQTPAQFIWEKAISPVYRGGDYTKQLDEATKEKVIDRYERALIPFRDELEAVKRIPIDLMGTIIYVAQVYDYRISQYDELLQFYRKYGTKKEKKSLASVAAWCGNGYAETILKARR